MDCRQIDEILDEHAVAGLGAAERTAVDEHLTGCGRCADAWLSQQALAGDVPPAPRPALWTETLALAGAGHAGAIRAVPGRRRMVTLGLAAGVLAVVAVAALLAPDRENPVEPVAGNAPTAPSAGGADGLPAAPVDLASRFVAGTQYEQLPAPAPSFAAPGRIEVVEFFMFGCPHCFAFEPAVAAWSAARPDYVEFVRVPALFNATARLHARAFYTADVLGRLDAVIEPFYEEIHVHGNALATVDSVRAFFGRLGIPGESFDEAFDSFAVETRMRRAEALNRGYRVTATPSIGVNGKYLTNGSMAGSNEAMLDVVDALVGSEAQALCPGDDAPRCPLH
jgi:protein dithiol oxidoreductase (disulfide-forming)